MAIVCLFGHFHCRIDPSFTFFISKNELKYFLCIVVIFYLILFNIFIWFFSS